MIWALNRAFCHKTERCLTYFYKLGLICLPTNRFLKIVLHCTDMLL